MSDKNTLSVEILGLAATDQTMRRRVANGEIEWDESVDIDSSRRLREIIDLYGWPTISDAGLETSHAAWLLIQHSPDMDFMERALGLMEALPEAEINPQNIAYLKDRILMIKGLPQIYGTQYKFADGHLRLWPVEDVNEVENRRKAIGLCTLAEDEAQLRRYHDL